ncbi:MAG TPA: bifunctional metallophosphatase/5'-nucleotidase [Thermoanaerobaculia bacterium]|jgi:2',3'-cyclic-nucleotide 2'-phosphodiesterase (5'-nucleotidase family)
MRRPLPWHLLALALPILAGCATAPAPPPTPPAPPVPAAAAPAAAERTAVLLAINDVYRIEGVEGGTMGGLARLRTLRQELEREHPDLLVLHAGDMLFPSFLSRTFNGQQMIDVLNLLDGSSGFDDRMFAVFGNHEFDKDAMKDAPMLNQRLHDSQFRWVNGNVVFGNGENGRPLVAGDNLAATYLVGSGGIRIGLFGLTTDVKHPQYVSSFKDPVATARELTAELRRQGAEVVVALTHLNARDDRRLLATLGDAGPDLILGGHDHEHMACDVGGREVLKADADARTATVARLTLAPGGKLAVEHQLVAIDPKLAEDCAVSGTVRSWLSLHAGLFCGQEAGKSNTPVDPRCLEKKMGSTRTLLEAEESKIRSSETAFGDWIADQMAAAFASCGAQAAFINSGSLRLNQDLAAGSDILRRHVEELFGFPAPLYLLRLKGKTLQQVAEHAIEGWPGSGNWLQIAGFSFVHDTGSAKVSDLELITPGGRRPVQPDEDILVVTNQFLFDPSQGNRDGYTMLDPSLVVKDCAVNGKDLKSGIVLPVLQATADGIAPEKEGRIRQVPEGTATDPCAGPV